MNESSDHISARLRPGLALTLLALGLLVVYAACQDVDEPTLVLDELSLRDILGLSPGHLDGLSSGERQVLRARILDEARLQEGWLADWREPEAPWDPRDLTPPWDKIPSDPLNAIVALDSARQQGGADAWLFGVFVVTIDGLETFGCTFADPDADTRLPDPPHIELGRADLPGNWADLVGFDADVDPEVGEAEPAWLKELAPRMEAWRERCLAAAGLPEAPDALRVVRQASAPYALSYWPQRRTLFVNPALLAIWRRDSASRPTPRLGTMQQAQLLGGCGPLLNGRFDMDTCTTRLGCICDKCTPQYVSAYPEDPDCLSPLFPGRPVSQDCADLREIDGGQLRYCVFEAMQSTGSPSVCMRAAGFAEACGTVAQDGSAVETRLETAARLKSAYVGFVDANTKNLCLAVLLGCLGDEVPLYIEKEVEPGVTQGRRDNCEHDCWDFCLNDTACNDSMGTLCGVDLFWWDPNRRGLNEVMCEEDQPTHMCGEDK